MVEQQNMSEFARSLYDNGSGEGPGQAMRRQRSRRRLSSGRSIRNMGAAAHHDNNEATGNAPGEGGPPARRPPGRQSSWYRDAMLQGAGEDLTAILGQQNAVTDHQGVTDNDEVLEQYKIMAEVEASMRVKENIGFDIIEYEKRQNMHPDRSKTGYYTGDAKPKPQLPEPRLSSRAANGFVPEEPPLPALREAVRHFVDQRTTQRVPELCPGEIVPQGQTQAPSGEHIVKCLGCKASLTVNLLASLVSCPNPDCLTVSPATTTRR